jgi:hypothetical protein
MFFIDQIEKKFKDQMDIKRKRIKKLKADY